MNERWFARALGAALLAGTVAGCALTNEDDTSGATDYSSSAVTGWIAPPCGASLGSFEGTVAHSNGANTGTGVSCAGHGVYGAQYQCVELVMRHFKTKWGISWAGNAAQLLANAPRAQVDVHENGGGRLPEPGDMIVWTNTTWGHVALVTAASAKSVSVLEQNVYGAAGTAVLPVSGGKVHGPTGWGWADPAGWAHAKANGGAAPSPAAPANPCANAEYGGDYCGSSRQYGFGVGDADTVYTCASGDVTRETHCTRACVVAPPGQADHCP